MHAPQPRPAITRRHLGAASLLAMPAIIARIGNVRGAAATHTVTIVAPGGWFQTNFDSIVLAAFRRAHRDIEVLYYPVGTAFQTLRLLRSQRAFQSFDIALLEAGVAATATTDDLFEPLTSDTMPVLKDLIPQANIPGAAGPAFLLDSLAFGYNPTSVAPAPHVWRNLWDPAFGHQIVLQGPPDPLGLAMTAVAAKLFGGSDMLQGLELGITALSQLAPRVVLWDPDPDIYTAITAGEASIGPCWNARARSQAALAPGQFATMIPDDGSPVMTTTINLVKHGPQREAARTLITWLLSPEAQRLLTETLFYPPVNAKADIPAASLARAGASPAMTARRMPMDWVVVDGIRDQISAEWRRQNLAGR